MFEFKLMNLWQASVFNHILASAVLIYLILFDKTVIVYNLDHLKMKTSRHNKNQLATW